MTLDGKPQCGAFIDLSDIHKVDEVSNRQLLDVKPAVVLNLDETLRDELRECFANDADTDAKAGFQPFRTESFARSQASRRDIRMQAVEDCLCLRCGTSTL
ncbi:hypothetical protein GCM10027344_16680 [Spelaeicoccus albus]